jgi:copper transport protein
MAPCKILQLLAVAALLAPLLASTATAHADIVSSEPAARARLDSPPAAVTILFSEPLEQTGTNIAVTDINGTRVDLGNTQVTNDPDPRARVDLRSNIGAGVYRVEWQTFSAKDGHPNLGEFGFSVGNYTAPAGSSSAYRVDSAAAWSRLLVYAGLSLAFGAAAFLLWVSPQSEDLARKALLLGATLHAIGILLIIRTTSSDLGTPVWSLLRDTGPGQILLLRLGLGLAAWLVALVNAVRPTQLAPAIGVALMVGAAIGSALVGHPFRASSTAAALDLFHLLAAGTWVGGLALFGWTLWHQSADGDPERLRRLGMRFGTLAMACVAILASTGVIVALVLVPRALWLDPVGLVATPYGVFLAGKILLALAMVGLAGINRYVLLEEPRETGLAGVLQRGAGAATGGRLRPGTSRQRSMKWTVATEATFGVVVLLLAGFLTTTSPPPVAAAGAGELSLHGYGDYYHVAVPLMAQPRVGSTGNMTFLVQELATANFIVNNSCGNADCIHVRVAQGGGLAFDTYNATLVPGTNTWQAGPILWTTRGEATIYVDVSTAEHSLEEVLLTQGTGPSDTTLDVS